MNYLIIFTSIYLIWAQFLIYKNLFLNFGPDVIYQNIPNSLIENYFIDTSLRSMIFEIGFIPLVFGIFIIYFFIFKKQRFLLSLFPFFLVFLLASVTTQIVAHPLTPKHRNYDPSAMMDEKQTEENPPTTVQRKMGQLERKLEALEIKFVDDQK